MHGTYSRDRKECKMNMPSIQTPQQSAPVSETCLSRRHSWDQRKSSCGKDVKQKLWILLNKGICTIRNPDVRLLRQLLCALCGFTTRSCIRQVITPSGRTDLLRTAVTIQCRQVNNYRATAHKFARKTITQICRQFTSLAFLPAKWMLKDRCRLHYCWTCCVQQ